MQHPTPAEIAAGGTKTHPVTLSNTQRSKATAQGSVRMGAGRKLVRVNRPKVSVAPTTAQLQQQLTRTQQSQGEMEGLAKRTEKGGGEIIRTTGGPVKPKFDVMTQDPGEAWDKIKADAAKVKPFSVKRAKLGPKKKAAAGNKKDDNTSPPEGPSLHETYGRLIDMLVEYKKKPKEYWERIDMGSELIGGEKLTPKERRKKSLTKTRKDRKRDADRAKAPKLPAETQKEKDERAEAEGRARMRVQ